MCDILVVCEPDILIFSVKEVAFKNTGDQVGWERWRRAAIEESVGQIAGAERWIAANPNVITKDGEPGLPFPPSYRVHRIGVALGSRGQVPMTFGEFGKGFVQVFDEESLHPLMQELYSKYTDSQLRSKFVGSLEDMARNSMTIHLPEE